MHSETLPFGSFGWIFWEPPSLIGSSGLGDTLGCVSDPIIRMVIGIQEWVLSGFGWQHLEDHRVVLFCCVGRISKR